MSNWVGLFINYETVGKKLKPHKTEVLDRRQSESKALSPHRAVIQINSTYLELIDRWNYQRGFVTFLSLCFMAIMSFGVGGLVYYSFYNPSYQMYFSDYLVDIIFILFLSGIVFIFFYMLKRECFSYTHFPIRFNRKLKKVYVIQPNKKILVANWQDFHIGLQQYSRSGWDVRFSLLDDQEKVTETFALPYTGFSQYSSELLEHWEFVRRYMEDNTAQASYEAVTEVFPIHHRKETFKESIQRVFLLSQAPYDKPLSSRGRLFFWEFSQYD